MSAAPAENRFGPIFYEPAVQCDGGSKFPAWHPPSHSHGADVGLKVNNTLIDPASNPVSFVPSFGRRVLWYTCGPTVYDSCHMGHARAYLTFDILRRIMEDYFGYEVTYHVNITDIDDKIILRARRNHLLATFSQDLRSTPAVVAETVAKAINARGAKLAAKRSELLSAVAACKQPGGDVKALPENETALAEHELKCGQFEHTKTVLSDVQGDRAVVLATLELLLCTLPGAATDLPESTLDSLGDRAQKVATTADDQAHIDAATAVGARAAMLVFADKNGVPPALIAAAADELGEWLDKLHGAGVTDKGIFDAHARKYEAEFLEDMHALDVREPDVLTRVTEYVPNIIAFIRKMVDDGLAYASGGSVYQSIAKYQAAGHSYRKLKPGTDTSEVAMQESEGALGSTSEKQHKNDFVLWKASKPGEPEWDSPWGKGRPGWHIECSVIASDILGANMDIHAGGIDLSFPHNDNELAQSEAFHGHQQWVNYFLHAGHLHIKGLKMSKSLKNFITIRQALKEHSARQLRLMFLMQPWDRGMNFSDQAVCEAKAREATFKGVLALAKAYLREDWLAGPIGWTHRATDETLYAAVTACKTAVHHALCNNFDTPTVVKALHTLVEEVHKSFHGVGGKPSPLLVRMAAGFISKILRMLGVIEGNDVIGFPVAGGGGVDVEATLAPVLDIALAFRDTIRALARNKASPQEFLQACDEFRDEGMVNVGVRVEDRPASKSLWKLDDADTLRRELAEKRERERRETFEKAKRKIDAKKAELEKLAPGLVTPAEMFRQDPTFSAWDGDGVPTHFAATGAALTDKERAALGKAIKLRVKTCEALHKKTQADGAADPAACIASLAAEVAALESALAASQLA